MKLKENLGNKRGETVRHETCAARVWVDHVDARRFVACTMRTIRINIFSKQTTAVPLSRMHV